MARRGRGHKGKGKGKAGKAAAAAAAAAAAGPAGGGGGFFARAQQAARNARRGSGDAEAGIGQPAARGGGGKKRALERQPHEPGAAQEGLQRKKVKQQRGRLPLSSSSSSSSKRSHAGGSGALVVAGATALEAEAAGGEGAGVVNPKSAGPFRSQDRILLVGEGNFSFAAGLSTRIGGSRIVASSLDTREEVIEKYGAEAMGSLQALRLSRAKVHHGIDATVADDLRSSLGQETAFDMIGFNFPHLGGATAEAVDANREMLRGFFNASKSVLAAGDAKSKRSRGGRVAVTLRSSPFYESWGLEEIAEEEGFETLDRMDFDKSLYPGYQEARTNPAARASPSTEAATTRVFALKAGSK